MITIKNKVAIQKMYYAGQVLSEIVNLVGSLIKPGMSSLELDSLIEMHMIARGLRSECKGYGSYKHVSCISINDEVVHGVPKGSRIIKEGDLVKIDVCASWRGYCADLARCFYIGTISNDIKKFLEVAQRALDKGIDKARVGNRLSDISAAIQQEIEINGYGVVRDFAGHGIGKRMHEDPEILNYGAPGRGPVLKAGMSFAIEPMLTMGHFNVYVTDDGWTVKTNDKSLAAHVEDTIVITDDGPYILTRVNQQGMQ